ncbi:MAG: ABC transporter permease [Chloroflexaceae bacterium]|nr:ABC transporter permease [Chloroflexaceae bacterium]
MKQIASRILEALLPFAAVGAALILGALMLAVLNVNPLLAYQSMAQGAFGSLSGITQTLTKATPLLLVGLGIAIAFRARMINIGGEGQLIVGTLATTAVALALRDLPGVLLLPLAALAGAGAGGVWAFIPGILKARLGANEILTTVMLNAIALQLMLLLLSEPTLMLDPAQVAAGTNIPQSDRVPQHVWLPRLVPQTLFHAGFIVALVLAVLVYVLLWRTTWGYRIRAIGENPHAARYAGISVPRYMTLAMTLSGMFCGLAGAFEVLGVHRRVVEGISGGYGFNGIVVALFGGLHPLGVIPSSMLFGALLVGADKMQRDVQVPAALITALNGLIVLFVVGSAYWVQRRSDRRKAIQTARQLERHAPAAELAPAAPANEVEVRS